MFMYVETVGIHVDVKIMQNPHPGSNFCTSLSLSVSTISLATSLCSLAISLFCLKLKSVLTVMCYNSSQLSVKSEIRENNSALTFVCNKPAIRVLRSSEKLCDILLNLPSLTLTASAL